MNTAVEKSTLTVTQYSGYSAKPAWLVDRLRLAARGMLTADEARWLMLQAASLIEAAGLAEDDGKPLPFEY